MKKYNLSKIMKRAWELVKKFGETISSALKKAWSEAKMVALKGSEKQVKWAEDIRKKIIKMMDKDIEKANERRIKRGLNPLTGGTRIKARKNIELIESAKFFIDNRYQDEETLAFFRPLLHEELYRQNKNR